MKFWLYNKKGFTLVELLVVISVIGLLSSVVFSSLNNARMKARDARRLSDIRQIQLALDLFYDKYGYFPYSPNCGDMIPNTGWCNSVQSTVNGQWIKDNGNTAKFAEFLAINPKDPTQGDTVYFPSNGETYYYFAAGYYPSGGTPGQWYMIVWGLEKYPNALLESQDGITAPNGRTFHYGNGSNGIITTGKNYYR